jgi:hypothetical protein
MLRIRHLLGLGLLVAVAAWGCETTREQLRPPKPPEEYNAPPDEARYTGPVQYPPEAMDQDALLKRANKEKDKGPGGTIGGRPGTPGGMGRMPGT